MPPKLYFVHSLQLVVVYRKKNGSNLTQNRRKTSIVIALALPSLPVNIFPRFLNYFVKAPFCTRLGNYFNSSLESF